MTTERITTQMYCECKKLQTVHGYGYMNDITVWGYRCNECLKFKPIKESAGATQDPKNLTKEQIREIGLQTLEDRMMEDENVYEVDKNENRM